MQHSNPNLLFEATNHWQDHTAHNRSYDCQCYTRPR